MISTKLPKILYGGDYNPEQWPEEVWLEDMRLMKKAGVNLVSIGIFSWASLQPNEITYNFEWLDRLLDMLAQNGIYADLATATAAQPAWLSQLPGVLPIDNRGNTVSYGSRQTYCPNSINYRNFSQQLVCRLADRYQKHPALFMWHINNEIACHTTSCYCENCAIAFRTWLQKKYGAIQRVNEAWGTYFWSQYYYEWDQIIPPRATSSFPNPSQSLDYKRFISDSLLDCYLGEYLILKTSTPNIPITTNFMVDFKPLDYFKWAKHLDVISWTNYPDPAPGFPVSRAAFNHDLMRGLKGGQPFILMEQAPNNVNWRPINTNKRPGIMSLWSYQAIAHGADAIMFFQWRQSLKGVEKFHSGMVSHSGNDQSRVFQEVTRLGEELSHLTEIVGSHISAEVGILFDYENWWVVEYDQRPSKSLFYLEQVRNFYNSLFDLNIPIDIISVDTELSKYKLIIAPLLHMVKSGFTERMESYVAGGGKFIMSFFSGIVDETDGVFPGGYPGPFKELLGIEIEEFDPLEPHMNNKIRMAKPWGILEGEYGCKLWGEVIFEKSAKSLATFTEDFYADKPAITENSYGKGKAYYIATQLDHDFYKEFLRHLCQVNQIVSVIESPQGVEATLRHGDDGSQYLFLLNHNSHEISVQLLNGKYRDLITGNLFSGKLKLAAIKAVILAKMIE